MATETAKASRRLSALPQSETSDVPTPTMKLLPSFALAFALVTHPCAAFAQATTPQASTPADAKFDGRIEERHLNITDLREISFDTTSPVLRFKANNTAYSFDARLSTETGPDRITVLSMLLAELRRSTNVTLRIPTAQVETDAREITVYSMVLHFAALK